MNVRIFASRKRRDGYNAYHEGVNRRYVTSSGGVRISVFKAG